MLQSGSSHSKLNSSLGGLAVHQGVNQAAAEAVAAAHTVDDVQVILLGEAVLVLCHIVQHGAPAVVERGVAFPQGDGNHLKAKLVSQLLGNGLVALMVQAAAVDVGGLGLDAEHVLGILLVGDAHVHILAQVGHGGTSLVTGPQLAAVVQVAGNLAAMSLGSLAGLTANLNHVLAQCRSDAGEVEPLSALEDGIPVEIAGLRFLDGGMSTVIDAHGATLRSTLLIEVDAHTIAATDNLGGVYAVAAQRVDSSLTDGVGGQLGDEGSVHAVVGQGHGNVCFAAAEGELHMVTLDKALVVIGLQPQHQFAKSNNLRHMI